MKEQEQIVTKLARLPNEGKWNISRFLKHEVTRTTVIPPIPGCDASPLQIASRHVCPLTPIMNSPAPRTNIYVA